MTMKGDRVKMAATSNTTAATANIKPTSEIHKDNTYRPFVFKKSATVFSN